MKPARAVGLACLLGVAAAAAAAADTPEIDPEASHAGIEVDLRIGGRVQGRFEFLEGRVERVGEDRLQVWVRFDARRLVLDGPGWMDRSMRSPKFLDVQAYPWIRFHSEPFAPALVREGGEMAGELELRGQRRPVRFTVAPSACEEPGTGCEITVTGQVNRRDFGMDAYRVWLRDEVGFDFHVRLRAP